MHARDNKAKVATTNIRQLHFSAIVRIYVSDLVAHSAGVPCTRRRQTEKHTRAQLMYYSRYIYNILELPLLVVWGEAFPLIAFDVP